MELKSDNVWINLCPSHLCQTHNEELCIVYWPEWTSVNAVTACSSSAGTHRCDIRNNIHGQLCVPGYKGLSLYYSNTPCCSTQPHPPQSFVQQTHTNSSSWSVTARRELLNPVNCDKELSQQSSLSTTINPSCWRKNLHSTVCFHQQTQTGCCTQPEPLI